MATLSLKNINKVYENRFEAVKNFNLDIEDKEFIVIAGPSGSGKSTLLRMIAGLEEITSGELWIEDKKVNTLEPGERNIAMIFQNCELYPDMSVYDNMAFGLKLKRVPNSEIDKLVRETAKLVEIEDLLEEKPTALSNLQKYRVAIGRALVRKPKVFLMYEPLSNFDAKLRIQMRTELAKLYKKLGTTIIYVTENQAEALALGTRVVVMKEGMIQQIATPKEMYYNPVNLFVAGFVGAPKMNLITAKVEKKGLVAKLVFGSNTLTLPEEKSRVLLRKGYEGKEVVFGIRPENIKEEDITETENVLEAIVKVYDLASSEAFLYLLLDEDEISVRVRPLITYRTDDKIKLAFDMSRVHIFDKVTENRIV